MPETPYGYESLLKVNETFTETLKPTESFMKPNENFQLALKPAERKLKVAELKSEGLSNLQIAERLQVSHTTVANDLKIKKEA